MPDADDFDVEYFRSLLAGKEAPPAKDPAAGKPGAAKPRGAASRGTGGKGGGGRSKPASARRGKRP
jgi:hypothetical protein